MASKKGNAREANRRWFLAIGNQDLLDKIDSLGSSRSKIALRALELGLERLLADKPEAAPSSLVEAREPAEPPPLPSAPKAPQEKTSLEHETISANPAAYGFGDDPCENPFSDDPVTGCPCSRCVGITHKEREDAELMDLVELSETWRSEDAAQ